MLTLAIQAGGVSSRMERDKALMSFLGKPLIVRVLERLAPLADEVIVTTNYPQNYAFLGLRCVPDLMPGRGALGGLYTALSAATHPLVAVAACDMPFASLSLLEFEHSLLVESGADAVVPSTVEGLEPLHAVYRREACLPAIQSALEAGKWKLIVWFPQANVRVLTPEETARCNPHDLVFWNLNTPEEFAEAERRAQSLDSSGL